MQQAATAPTPRASGLARYPPIVGWLPHYNRAWLGADLIAAVTVAAFAVPESIAHTAGAEKALELANERGWIVASVKDDWAIVFDTP